MANLQEFHFSTGVKPYSHVPAVPVGKHEFVDVSGYLNLCVAPPNREGL